VAPLVNGKGLPTITPCASDPQLLDTGPYMLCVSDTDIKKVRALAQRLYQDGGRNAAVFANESSILSRSLAEVFVERFQELGGKIALNETYPPNQLDFSLQLQHSRQKQADCVFLAEYRTQPVVGFCETMRRLGFNVLVAAQTPGSAENLFHNGTEAVEGLYVSTYYVHNDGSAENQRFVRDFRQMFGGRLPSHREVQAYDSLRLAVKALDTVGPDRAKVLQYLQSVGTSGPPYVGVSGSFAPSISLDARPAHVLRVSHGTYQLLD
jgi:branched-chain amino acid transport system substrate-binding protein